MKSFMAKPETIQKKWYLIDADGQVLGRLASQVAAILRGKNKPEFTPNVDTGDHVVIINTDKVVLTGKKLEQKLYRRHSGKPAISRKSSTASLWRKEAISPSCRQSRVCFPKTVSERQCSKRCAFTRARSTSSRRSSRSL